MATPKAKAPAKKAAPKSKTPKSGIGAFNNSLQASAAKAKAKTDKRLKAEDAAAAKAAKEEQKRVDAKRKERDAKKK